MRVRRQIKHGNLRWVVDYQDGRNRRHQKFFKDRDEATAFANTVSARRGSPPPAFSARQIFNAYLNATRHRRAPNTQKVIGYRLGAVVAQMEQLGRNRAHDINVETFNLVVDALAARGLSPHTVRGYMASYRSVIQWACRQGILNPTIQGDMRIAEPHQRRERFLSKQEIDRLLEATAADPIRLPIALGVFQGLRRHEVCDLRMADLNLGRNQLAVGKTKTRQWRVVQIHPRLHPYLPVPPTEDSWLCQDRHRKQWRPDTLGRTFRRIADGLGPEWADVTFHTLRHTCASQMALSSKYTLWQIARFLGHTQIQTTQRYAHLMPDQITPDW